MSNLCIVKQKIQQGLEARREIPLFAKAFFPVSWQEKIWLERPAPKTQFQLAVFLGSILDDEDFEVLSDLENEIGEDAANDWLCEVLSDTEHYEQFEDGCVAARL